MQLTTAKLNQDELLDVPVNPKLNPQRAYSYAKELNFEPMLQVTISTGKVETDLRKEKYWIVTD